MSARARRKLTDAAIDRLRPHAREYTVWDGNVPGLGVRVRPSGGKTWVMLEGTDACTRRVSLGPVSTMTVGEARRACHGRQASPETTEPARLGGCHPHVPGLRRGRLAEGAFRALEAHHQEDLFPPPRRPPAPRLRSETHRSHRPGARPALVRQPSARPRRAMPTTPSGP